MKPGREPRQTAPGCQLSQAGTPFTYATLLHATRQMSDAELKRLEGDLILFDETGFVGLYMSRLLDLLHREHAFDAA